MDARSDPIFDLFDEQDPTCMPRISSRVSIVSNRHPIDDHGQGNKCLNILCTTRLGFNIYIMFIGATHGRPLDRLIFNVGIVWASSSYAGY